MRVKSEFRGWADVEVYLGRTSAVGQTKKSAATLGMSAVWTAPEVNWVKADMGRTSSPKRLKQAPVDQRIQ